MIGDNHVMDFLEGDDHSVAYHSVFERDTLIVFVHGFWGHATNSWDDFLVILRNDDRFRECDFIFYGYDSATVQAAGNAAIFYHRLKRWAVLRPDAKGKERYYSRIVILAHSLGAIVVRRALLSARQDKVLWLDNCRMILFAPAHLGAYPGKLLLEGLSVRPLNILAVFLKAIFPVLRDLEPDSNTIKALIADTKKVLLMGKGKFTIASAVLMAPRDKVVALGRFCDDPVEIIVEWATHTNICKPVLISFDEPVNILSYNI